MQSEQKQHDYRSRRVDSFNLPSPIWNWNDFKETWKQAKFNYGLNSMDDVAIQLFWKENLDLLCKQEAKICILVPNEVDGQVNEKKKEGKKNDKNQANNKVKLRKEIIEACISLIQKEYKLHLDYDYEPLFMGNEKQLLIFRKCQAIERYLEKYRLPNNHKNTYDDLQNEATLLFKLKINRNYAISTENLTEIQQLTDAIKSAQAKFNEKFSHYQKMFQKILIDFKGRAKVQQIVLIAVRDNIKALLAQVCSRNDLFLEDKYASCQNDEFKDVRILKDKPYSEPSSREINDFEDQISDENDESAHEELPQEDIYPDKRIGLPKEIEDFKLIAIDFEKHCYRCEVSLLHFSENNKIEGVFIRSIQNALYQLNVDVKSTTKRIEIQLYPYRIGYCEYQIFTWNEVGFVKCEQKFKIFNELQLKGTKYNMVRATNNLHLMGTSNEGILMDKKTTNQTFQKQSLGCCDFSLSNCVAICDKGGDVAAWGQLYSGSMNTEDEEEEINEEEDEELISLKQIKMKIEPPCLLLAKKWIRKITCGLGYIICLDIFGKMYSMGANHFGQLGLGHCRCDFNNEEFEEIRNFTKHDYFITDIKTTVNGSSFAIDKSGILYRWGPNQVESTRREIRDNFGSLVNFSPHGFIYKQPSPIPVSKNQISGKVIAIQGGMGFFLALNSKGVLYGWGQCKYLGLGLLLDFEQNEVKQIVNPIEIMKDIKSVTAGLEHWIAVTNDSKVFGCGNSKAFTQSSTQLIMKPIQVTKEFQAINENTILKSGPNYTLITQNNGTIKIIGQQTAFKEKTYVFDQQILKIECSNSLIGVLSRQSQPNTSN